MFPAQPLLSHLKDHRRRNNNLKNITNSLQYPTFGQENERTAASDESGHVSSNEEAVSDQQSAYNKICVICVFFGYVVKMKGPASEPKVRTDWGQGIL